MNSEFVDELRLRNGERIVVRPIRPADADALARLHARLSPDSIYLRYFGVKPTLRPAEIYRFTVIAEEWRFALVAATGSGELIGVARYEGRAGQGDAEIALVVDDTLHHQGLGTLLMQRLVDAALLAGLTSVTAEVLTSNTPMLKLLHALPLPFVFTRDSGYVEARLLLGDLRVPEERARIATAHLAQAAAIRAGLTGPRQV